MSTMPDGHSLQIPNGLQQTEHICRNTAVGEFPRCFWGSAYFFVLGL